MEGAVRVSLHGRYNAYAWRIVGWEEAIEDGGTVRGQWVDGTIFQFAARLERNVILTNDTMRIDSIVSRAAHRAASCARTEWSGKSY